MVSASGALGGAATGASIGSLVPGIGTAIGAGVGGLIGLFGGGGSGGAATAPSGPLFTPEMLQQLLAASRGYLGSAENIYGTPSMGPGGISTSQASRINSSDMKKDAFIKFRMSKGDTLEQATQKANQVTSDPSVRFKHKKGFVNAIQDGQFEDLSLTGQGGIQAREKYTPGGVQASSESEMLRNFIENLQAQSFSAVSGLPSAYRADENRALAVRNPLTASILGQVGNINELGLTDTEQANLDAINDYYKKEWGGIVDKTTSDFIAGTENTGFGSSSIAPRLYMDLAGKPQAEYASDIAAKLAMQYNDMLGSRATRQNTALTGTMNAFNTIGKLGNADNIMGLAQSPGNFGLFTDPTAAALAAEIQQANIGNRAKNQAMYQEALSMPVNFMGSSEGPDLSQSVQGLMPYMPSILSAFNKKGVSTVPPATK